MSTRSPSFRLGYLLITGAALFFTADTVAAADFEPFTLEYEIQSEQLSAGQGTVATTKATIYVVPGEEKNSRRYMCILAIEGDQFPEALPLAVIESDPDTGAVCMISDGLRGSPASVLLMPLLDHGVPTGHLGKAEKGLDDRVVITAATYSSVPLEYESKPAEGESGRWAYNVKLARPMPVSLGALQLNLKVLSQKFVFGPEQDYPIQGEWEQIEETTREGTVTGKEARMRAELKSRKALAEKDELKLEKEFQALSSVWENISQGVIASLEEGEKKLAQYMAKSDGALLMATAEPMKAKLAKRLRDARKLANPEVELKKLIGKAAPDFALKDLTGTEVKLSSYKGKVVLVTFWGLGCRLCQAALPALQKVYAEFNERGFMVLGADAYEDPKARVQQFATDLGITYPILLGGSGVAWDHYSVTDYPTLFCIDRAGKIRSYYIEWKATEGIDALKAELTKLLSEGGG